MFERILLVSIPNEKEREIIMRVLQVFVAVLNLSNGDMHNFLETRTEKLVWILESENECKK